MVATAMESKLLSCCFSQAHRGYSNLKTLCCSLTLEMYA